MIFYSNVSIEHRGRQYNGRFSIDGGHVCVDSAYGSSRCVVARDAGKAKAQAQGLLRRIVMERYG
jgi:hypothetical protein